jgi:hypothetical protein
MGKLHELIVVLMFFSKMVCVYKWPRTSNTMTTMHETAARPATSHVYRVSHRPRSPLLLMLSKKKKKKKKYYELETSRSVPAKKIETIKKLRNQKTPRNPAQKKKYTQYKERGGYESTIKRAATGSRCSGLLWSQKKNVVTAPVAEHARDSDARAKQAGRHAKADQVPRAQEKENIERAADEKIPRKDQHKYDIGLVCTFMI